MRLTLVIATLWPGGAERVLATMANYWADRGHEVVLITLCEGSDFFPLDPRVERISLNSLGLSPTLMRRCYNTVMRVWRLRRAIKAARPQAVISFEVSMNLLVVLAMWGLGMPVIVSERAHPDPVFAQGFMGWLRHWCYRRAAAVVVQTGAIEREFQRLTPGARLQVIPNPVAVPPPPARPASLPWPVPFVLAVGRLHPVKGFDRLLHAFARHAHRHDWPLVILGEGEARGELEALRQQLDLVHRVWLPGVWREPWLALQQASMFVLSSYREGFPNVLLEAMAQGVAVLSVDCPSGPREIISPEENGVLVDGDSTEALGDALWALIQDPERCQRLGECARRVRQIYADDVVMADWEALIRRCRERLSGGVARL